MAKYFNTLQEAEDALEVIDELIVENEEKLEISKPLKLMSWKMLGILVAGTFALNSLINLTKLYDLAMFVMLGYAVASLWFIFVKVLKPLGGWRELALFKPGATGKAGVAGLTAARGVVRFMGAVTGESLMGYILSVLIVPILYLIYIESFIVFPPLFVYIYRIKRNKIGRTFNEMKNEANGIVARYAYQG